MTAAADPPSHSVLKELEMEAEIGGIGGWKNRSIPVIDMSDFASNRERIKDELWEAATTIGFFQLVNHGISPESIDDAFHQSSRFFALPSNVKEKYPFDRNVGYESLSQVRPSTGTKDQKESYQITRSRMDAHFPTEDELAGFKESTLKFERANWELGQKLLACFAEKLNLPVSELTSGHDHRSEYYQCTLRLLHYYEQKPEDIDPTLWRAGAHTDFDSITLLHQRHGQGGLEVCPGIDRESHAWTPVSPENHIITCNIGDMLQRWSDDQLKSTLHRVRSPRLGEDLSDRYSIAFFLQANKDAILKGPKEVYPEISAGEFIQQRLDANYKLLSKLK